MMIRRRLIVLLLLCLVPAGAILAQGGVEAKDSVPADASAAPSPGPEAAAAAAAVPLPPTSAHPPKQLKFASGHWTAWDPPMVPDGANPYVVVPGDTLWGLSGKFNGNPMLWPLVWDQNRYILDTHWIYPGDPILVPAAPTVVPPASGAEAEGPGGEGMEEEQPIAAIPAPVEPQQVALADTHDLYCSDYIDSDLHKPALKIAELEQKSRISQAEGDVVYLNRGSKQGTAAGDEYDIIHPAREISDPRSGRVIGTLVERRGRVKVLAVEPDTSTAMITFSCVAIGRGDRLVPRWDPEVPMGVSSLAPALQLYGSPPSGKAAGTIIATPFNIVAVGQGHVVQVTLGQDAGLKPGDWLSIFRPNEAGPEYARKMLGLAMVVTTRPKTAAVKIMESVRDVYRGDRVEIQ